MTKKNSSGLGLDTVGDLSDFLDASAGAEGKPLMLDVDAIDPDPEQPRKQDNPGSQRNPLRSWLIPLKRVV